MYLFSHQAKMMKMKVVVPVRDFQFNTTNLSTPSTPKAVGDPSDYFYHHASAPTSPRRATAIYAHFSDTRDDNEALRFSFDCMQLENAAPTLAAANELFEGGRIKTSNPPPYKLSSSSSHHQQEIGGGRRREEGRGRQRAPAPSTPSSGSGRVSGSLSYLRGEGDLFCKSPSPSNSASTTSSHKKGGRSKRWKLRDLLLFRSASDGQATGTKVKVPLDKLLLNRSLSERNQRTGSFGSIEREESMEGLTDRDARERIKKASKKPPVHFRYGLFGYLRFNPAVHGISKGFNSSVFNRNKT